MAKKSKQENKFFFYDTHDFDYQMHMSEQFWTMDGNFKIKLYRIDVVKSKTHKIYGEAKAVDKKFLPPVDLGITLEIGEKTTSHMSGDGIVKQNLESFKCGIFISELERKNIVVKRGDFFLYNDNNKERFFEITNVDDLTINNTAYGLKPFYIVINGNLVKDDAILKSMNK